MSRPGWRPATPPPRSRGRPGHHPRRAGEGWRAGAGSPCLRAARRGSRSGAADHRAVGVAAPGGRGEIPSRVEGGGDRAEPKGQLGVGAVGELVSFHHVAELRGKHGLPGHASEEVPGHERRPGSRGEQLERRRRIGVHAGRGRDQLLRLVHHVSGDIGKPVPLDADVEVPGGASERPAVDRLLQVMHARDLDAGLPGADVEVAEHVALSHELAGEDRRDVVAARHHLHGERPARHDVAEIVEAVRLRHPRLVREHVEARVVKTAHGRHLPVVPPGEDGDLARAIRDQLVEWAVRCSENRAPGRGLSRTPVEGLDEGEEVVELRPRPRVDEDLIGDPRLTRTESERSVEVARLEEAEGVRDRLRRQARRAASPRSRTRQGWRCFPGDRRASRARGCPWPRAR
jgi:hypothetical protein